MQKLFWLAVISASNILLYGGDGTDPALTSGTNILLNRLLPSYTVQLIQAKHLEDRDWVNSTDALIIPGGRDLPYVRDLVNANQNIIEYVERGGNFIGLGAGAYYASARVEFELGTKYEVVGDRPLKFYPGTCRGATFSGFEYSNARAVSVTVDEKNIPMYYKGGGSFLDVGDFSSVETLATYKDTNVTFAAAVIFNKIKNGRVLLSSVHPEYVPVDTSSELNDQLSSHRSEIDSQVSKWFKKLNLIS